MALFLILIFPLYLSFAFTHSRQTCGFYRIFKSFCTGLLAFALLYLFSRLIANKAYYPWEGASLYLWLSFQSREAFFRLCLLGILVFFSLQRYRQSHNANKRSSLEFSCQELISLSTGYFFAASIYTSLLLNSYSDVEQLFYMPLNRLLFVQLLSLSFGLIPKPGKLAWGVVLLFLAVFGLHALSLIYILSQYYWFLTFTELLMVLGIAAYLYFDEISQDELSKLPSWLQGRIKGIQQKRT